MRRNEKGFTLMELMVVIVIVAILAAVAVPLYINYVRDAQRTEAKGAIGAVITAQQTFYQRWQRYCSVIDPDSLNVDLSDVEARWTAAMSGVSGTGFTVTFTGTGNNLGLSVACQYTRGADPIWTEN
jgi:type IV pilus assembly protein PilE